MKVKTLHDIRFWRDAKQVGKGERELIKAGETFETDKKYLKSLKNYVEVVEETKPKTKKESKQDEVVEETKEKE